MDTFKNTLQRMKAPAGKYAVKGNFDVWYFRDDLFSKTGFQTLDGKLVRLKIKGEEICIAGLSYDFSFQAKTLTGALDPNIFNIFLYHTPDLIEDLDHEGPDLLFSRTHPWRTSSLTLLWRVNHLLKIREKV